MALPGNYMLEVIFMTFSIVARDVQAGELGIAVQSKFLAVGAVVPWARAGVGAIATQSWANTTYGPRGLELLASGLSASKTIEQQFQPTWPIGSVRPGLRGDCANAGDRKSTRLNSS